MITPQKAPQRILAIDDQAYILHIIRHTLTEAGFEVSLAKSSNEALQHIDRHGIPYLILVDLHMPHMDGFEFCETVREFSDVPIIMVTAVSDEPAIIEGLEKYADDYIIKPFEPQELLARVKRVLRRIPDYNYTIAADIHINNNLHINFPRREITRNNKIFQLTPTETKLLHILVRNANHFVTTNFLVSRIWPLENATEDRLHVHIHRLREKIEQDPEKPKHIISERSVGYKFIIK